LSYTPKYTDETKVESLLQISVDVDTVPTSGELLNLIQRVEAEMDARRLGSYTSTDELVDADGSAFIQPSNLPIISVNSLYENEAEPYQAANYKQRTEGPGEGTSFLIVRREFAGKLLGIGLYFYDNVPKAGRARLKITYDYGFDFPSLLLEEYATKRVALEVLQVRAANESYNVNLAEGPQAALYRELKERVRQLNEFFQKFESVVKG
jgi:hypothetical protein